MTLKNTSVSDNAAIYLRRNYGKNDIADYQEYTVKQIINTEIIDENLNIKTTGYIQAISYNPDVKKVFYSVLENFGEDNVSLYVYAEYQTDDELKFYTNVARGEYISLIGNISKVTSKADNKDYKAIKIKEANLLYSRPYYQTGNLLVKDNTTKALKSISFKNYVVDENNYSGKGAKTVNFTDVSLTLNGSKYAVDKNLGINMKLDSHMNNFGEAVVYTFEDFGNGASLIFRTLGELFTSAESWKNIGGILAVGVTTTRVLQEYGFAQFLFYWALISVNLGIVNLLPFPGLDGWQILVTIIEGITRKEIPPKVKGWVSAIGIAILFALMILILVKDIIGLF